LYERARTTLINYWLGDRSFNGNPAAASAYVDTMRLTQSFLRLELPLAITTTNYTFAVTQQQKGGAATFNTEQLLNLQDSFVVNEIGFYITLNSSATDTTAQLKTFMNVPVDTNAAAMQAYWTSGIFNLQVNNEVIIPAWDLNRHFYIPQTQAATFVVGTTTGQSMRTK
jgi:hypothetical protein